jgi:hypothetical protein
MRRRGLNKVCEERHDMYGPHENAVHDRHAGYFYGRKCVQYAGCQSELVVRTKQRCLQC